MFKEEIRRNNMRLIANKKTIAILIFSLIFILFFVGCTTFSEEVYRVEETFSSIEIDDVESGIMISPSYDGRCRVLIDERSNGSVYHTVEVEHGVLKINRHTKGVSWLFGESLGELLVEVQLPKKEYSSLSASSVSGRIIVENGLSFDKVDLNSTSGSVTFSAVAKDEITAYSTSGSVNISTNSVLYSVDARSTSGRVYLSDIKARKVYAKSNSGSVVLNNVIALDNLSLYSTSGSIRLDHCDGGDIYIESSSGSVKGTLLSDKYFRARSNTGRVDVPYSYGVNICDVKTTSGSIVLSII